MNAGDKRKCDGLIGREIEIFAVDPQVSQEPVSGRIIARMTDLDMARFGRGDVEIAKAWLVQLDELLEYYDILSEQKVTRLKFVALLFWNIRNIDELLESGRVQSCDIHLYAVILKNGTFIPNAAPDEVFGLSKETDVRVLP